LNDNITNLEVRNAMEKILKPNPELTSMIERECPKNNWACVISRIWPNTMFIASVLSGSMQQYVPIVRYFVGDISLISFCYFASECNIVGLNLQLDCAPNKVEYMILPEIAYFEFIPFIDALNDDNLNNDNTGEALQVVDLVDVEFEIEIMVINVFSAFL
jgi:auxin responsive GH3 family protein